MRVADVRAAVGRLRALAYRVLDTVPPVRRTVDELVRVTIVDRAMVIGAQGLLALVPMVIVLAAFLPESMVSLGLDRFESMTGLGDKGGSYVEQSVEDIDPTAGVDADQVRATTGVIGILITLFSASSYAKAIQRMYERVWEQPHRGGFVGRRRCLAWLLGWLVLSQALTLVGLSSRALDLTVLAPLWFVVRAAVSTGIWWWSMRVLLFRRVGWGALFLPALVTGVAVTVYTGGSTLVMPRYVASSAIQFGTFGLVLALATWLVGYAGVIVVSAVVGRVLAEDPAIRSFGERLVRQLPGASRSGAGTPPPPG
jgi:membrane protein